MLSWRISGTFKTLLERPKSFVPYWNTAFLTVFW